MLWVGGLLLAAQQLQRPRNWGRSRRRNIAVVGDCFVDILAVGLDSLPSWGSDLRAPQIAIAPGGSGMNTATHLSALLANAAPVHPIYCDLHSVLGCAVANAGLLSVLSRPCCAFGFLYRHNTGPMISR
jgi:hypothetical protein